MPSGSSLERAVLCPGSTVLPHVGNYNEAALKGTMLHDFIQKAILTSRETALQGVPEEFREAAELVDFSRLPKFDPTKPIEEQVRFEMAMAYDILTGKGRLIGYNLERDYGELAPSEVAASIDMVWMDQEWNTVHVYDIKTGRKDVTPAIRNWQLKIAALAVRTFWEAGQVQAGIAYSRNGGVWYDWTTFTLAQLDRDAETLRRAYAKWLRASPGEELVTGKHCSYCPALQACPAMTGLLRGVAGQERDTWVSPNPADNEAMVSAYNALQAAKAGIRALEDNINTIARVFPIDLGGDTVYTEIVGNGRNELDYEKAKSVLGTTGGLLEEATKVEHSISQTDLKRACNNKGIPWTGVQKALKEAGAYKWVPFRAQMGETTKK